MYLSIWEILAFSLLDGLDEKYQGKKYFAQQVTCMNIEIVSKSKNYVGKAQCMYVSVTTKSRSILCTFLANIYSTAGRSVI